LRETTHGCAEVSVRGSPGGDVLLESLRSMLGMSLCELASLPVMRAFPRPEVCCFEDAVYLDFWTSGLSLVCEPRNGVVAVQLHAAGRDGFDEWCGGLPEGLSFGMGRPRLRELLGRPEAYGSGQFVAALGWKHAWDLFRTPSGFIHIEYRLSAQAGFQLLTLQA
jgi:hypothetical protein